MVLPKIPSVSSTYTGKFASGCTDTWTTAGFTGIDNAAITKFDQIKAYTDSVSTELTLLKTDMDTYSANYG